MHPDLNFLNAADRAFRSPAELTFDHLLTTQRSPAIDALTIHPPLLDLVHTVRERWTAISTLPVWADVGHMLRGIHDGYNALAANLREAMEQPGVRAFSEQCLAIASVAEEIARVATPPIVDLLRVSELAQWHTAADILASDFSASAVLAHDLRAHGTALDLALARPLGALADAGQRHLDYLDRELLAPTDAVLAFKTLAFSSVFASLPTVEEENEIEEGLADEGVRLYRLVLADLETRSTDLAARFEAAMQYVFRPESVEDPRAWRYILRDLIEVLAASCGMPIEKGRGRGRRPSAEDQTARLIAATKDILVVTYHELGREAHAPSLISSEPKALAFQALMVMARILEIRRPED